MGYIIHRTWPITFSGSSGFQFEELRRLPLTPQCSLFAAQGQLPAIGTGCGLCSLGLGGFGLEQPSLNHGNRNVPKETDSLWRCGDPVPGFWHV